MYKECKLGVHIVHLNSLVVFGSLDPFTPKIALSEAS